MVFHVSTWRTVEYGRRLPGWLIDHVRLGGRAVEHWAEVTARRIQVPRDPAAAPLAKVPLAATFPEPPTRSLIALWAAGHGMRLIRCPLVALELALAYGDQPEGEKLHLMGVPVVGADGASDYFALTNVGSRRLVAGCAQHVDTLPLDWHVALEIG